MDSPLSIRSYSKLARNSVAMVRGVSVARTAAVAQMAVALTAVRNVANIIVE